MAVQSLDAQLLLFINHGTANGLFDILMPALSARGYLLAIPFLLAMLLRAAKQKDKHGKSYLRTALWTIAIAACAWYLAEWVEHAVKAWTARTRPCRAIEGIRLIVACPKSFSMPSGHSITSFAVALPLFYLTREYIELIWRFYPLLLASAIAFSRLYLGVHYPTDVFAGALLGAAIAMTLSMLYEQGTEKISDGPRKIERDKNTMRQTREQSDK
jgi:undecaprenyl-diphosphatase